MHTKSVAVIGAGIAGCSTAYKLAKRGFTVTLYEKTREVASAASGNPLGMLYPRLSASAPDNSNIHSDYALAAYQYALEFYNDLPLTKAVFNQCGMLQLAYNQRESARVEKAAKATATHIAYKVNGQQATEIAGIACNHAALFFPYAAWLQPKAACQSMLNNTNIKLKTYSEVKDIQIHDDDLALKTDTTHATFDYIVISNAHDALQFSQSNHLVLDTVAGQLSQVTATPLSNYLKTIICTDGYLSPAIDGLHTVGATFQPNDTSLAVTTDNHIANLQKVEKFSAPIFEDIKNGVKSGRTALRCVSRDRLPMVGQLLNTDALKKSPPRPNAAPSSLPWQKGLFVNIAHGSHGLMSAPFTGQCIANAICNTLSDQEKNLLTHLNPNRFFLREMGLKQLAKTASCANAPTK